MVDVTFVKRIVAQYTLTVQVKLMVIIGHSQRSGQWQILCCAILHKLIRVLQVNPKGISQANSQKFF